MRRVAFAALLVVHTAWFQPAVASSLPARKPIGTCLPFVKPESLLAMQEYIARKSLETGKDIAVPDEFYKSAPLIKYWGYRFEVNDIGTYDVIFEQVFDATSLSSGVVEYIGSLRDDGCSYYKTTNARISGLASKRIDATAGISGKQRACDNILGTHDIGDIGGVSDSHTNIPH